MRKRRVRQRLAAGILLTLVAIWLMPRERLLRHVAIEIVSLQDCVATDSDVGANSEGYAWLSNDDLLILRAKPQKSGLAQVEAIRHNVHTQRETPFADFNRRQANALVSTSSYPADSGNLYARQGLENARLSPDRQQLLWHYGPYQHWHWHVARLDGTTVADFKNTDKKPNFSCVNWLPDNRQWVSTNSTPLFPQPFISTSLLDLRFYSTDPKSGVVKKTLDSFQASRPLAFLRNGHLLSTNAPGGLSVKSKNGPDGLLLNMGEALWKHEIDPPWHYKRLDSTFYDIFLPGVDIVNEIVVSSDETRFALCCRVSQTAGLPPLMQMLRQWLRRPDRKVWAICTCRLDGSDFREIGHLPERSNPVSPQSAVLGFTTPDISPKEASTLPHNLKWSPDGKHLTYCQSNALYMVPVE